MRTRTAKGRSVGAGLLVAVLAMASAVRPHAQAELIDRVLAVVADALITQSDAQAFKDLQLTPLPASADLVKDVLPRLIDRALMLIEVERYAPPEPPAAALDRQVALIRARFTTPEAFDAALARVGFDERHLRETVRQDLRIAAYVTQRFVPPPPTDDDVARYYREHPDRFTDSGRALSLAQARVQVVAAATEEARQKMVSEWVGGLRRRTEIVDLSGGR